MAEIVLKDRSGAEQTYSGVDIIKLNTSSGELHTFGAYDPAVLTPDKLVEGVTVGNVAGSLSLPELLENVPVTLDFSEGDQTIYAPDGYLVKSAIIQKPDALIPENIAIDVEIAGVIGSHKGGGDNQPQLHAPSIAIADVCKLSIANPETNGDFVTGYKIFMNGVYYTTITEASADLDAIVTDPGDYTVTATCIGMKFKDSEQSDTIEYTNIFFSISNDLTNCNTNNSAASIRKGSSYSAVISCVSGSTVTTESVRIIMSGTDITSSVFSFEDMTIDIPAVTGDLSITISAEEQTADIWLINSRPNTSSNVQYADVVGSTYVYDGENTIKVSMTRFGVSSSSGLFYGDFSNGSMNYYYKFNVTPRWRTKYLRGDVIENIPADALTKIRTISFFEAPPSRFLTWLQANAVHLTS